MGEWFNTDKRSFVVHVGMTGKEYMEYTRRKPLFSRRFMDFWLASGPYFLSAAVALTGLFVLLEQHESAPIPYFQFFGLPLMQGLPSLVGIGLAFGLGFHGIALIRR